MTVSIKPRSLMDWMPSRSPRIASVVPAAPPVPRPPAARPAAPATPAATVPATAAQLQADFADDPAFAVEATRQRWTLADAHRAYGKRMKAEVAARRQLLGQAAVQTDGAAAYLSEVQRIARTERVPIHEATSIVNKYNPNLRLAYIEANRRAGRAGKAA